ncbi:MAG: MltA domain-containing protein, partial [Desulfobulbaceae bacterium]|nr:MltA domain-containing protein [Desulfobulbaceae bacterium]
IPKVYDDGDLASLRKTLLNSLIKLESVDPAATVSFGENKLPVKHLIASLKHLLLIISDNPDSATLDARIQASFDVYRSTGYNFFSRDGAILVTGYYQPVFSGSTIRRGDYRYPLYKPPKKLFSGLPPSDNNPKEYSKAIDWSRKAIETKDLCRGYELVWLRDPMDVYLLHVQGSGLIRLGDGSLRGVGYSGTNGLPYRSIGFHLVATGRLSAKEVSLSSIRRYIDDHPREREDIFFHNESYIFFRWREGNAAQGSLGVDLTPDRSIAVDNQIMPLGAIFYLRTIRPTLEKGGRGGRQSFCRLVVGQDTGSAIKGAGRVDLFCGTGDEAGEVAGNLKQEGLLYCLLLKQRLLAQKQP